MSRKHFRVVRFDGVTIPERVGLGRTEGQRDVSIRFWTPAEWSAMHPAEQPKDAIELPDVGHVLVQDLETVAQRHHAECLENEHRIRCGVEPILRHERPKEPVPQPRIV